MSSWVFEARDGNGQPVSGVREAPDRQAALDALRAQGLFLTRLELSRAAPAPAGTSTLQTKPAPWQVPAPANSSHNVMPQLRPAALERFRNVTSPKAQAAYFYQLTVMLHAGTNLGEALFVLKDEAPDAALRQASAAMYPRVLAGEPLSTRMLAHPEVFTPAQIGMILVGERSGFLERVTRRLAMYAEWAYRLQQMVRRETFHLRIVAWLLILQPAIKALAIFGINGFVLMLPLIIVNELVWLFYFKYLLLIFRLILKQTGWAYNISKMQLGSPAVRALAMAQFFRALSLLYTAGVLPAESVRLAAGASGNEALTRDVTGIVPRLENGERLTTALEASGHFSRIVIGVLRTGEDACTLPEQLGKLADSLEHEAEAALKRRAQWWKR